MNKKENIMLLIASYTLMLTIAISESIRGLVIPILKVEFSITDTQVGIFLVVSTIAYIFGTYLANKLCHKIFHKKTILIGILLGILSSLLTSYAASFNQLMLFYTIFGVAVGVMILGLNTIVPLLKISYIAIVLNTLHFFYGLGASTSQRVTGYYLTLGGSWRMIFKFFILLYIIAFILYLFVKQPPTKFVEPETYKIKKYERFLVILFCTGLGFYVSAEIQTANWLINYLHEIYQFTENTASKYLSSFYLLLALGRLFGGFVVEKIGYLKSVLGTVILALIMYIIGLSSEKLLVLISISGAFFAIVYPTTILIVNKLFEDNKTRIVSIITMVGSFINMTSGYIVGKLNDVIGTYYSYYSIPIMLLLSVISFILVSVESKRVLKIREEL